MPVYSAPWYLDTLRRLIADGQMAEAYQLVLTGIDLHPDDAELRVGAAYVAAKLKRCRQAARHLSELRKLETAADVAGHARLARITCFGSWQRHYTVSATMGYRQSLVDRAQVNRLYPQIGSPLYRFCSSLWGLCDPDAGFRLSPPRDNGIDLWLQTQIIHQRRPMTPWQNDIITTITRRQPARSGFEGQGISVRLITAHQFHQRNQVTSYAEFGRSSFRQGHPALGISQLHKLMGINLIRSHADHFSSGVNLSELQIDSQWLDQRRRTVSYRLMSAPTRHLSIWVDLERRWDRQVGLSYQPGSRTRKMGGGVRHRRGRLQFQLSYHVRKDQFRRRLSFLAFAHRATSRQTHFDVTLTPQSAPNLKVVLSLQHRRISTPNPFRPRTTRNATLSVKYRFGQTP